MLKSNLNKSTIVFLIKSCGIFALTLLIVSTSFAQFTTFQKAIADFDATVAQGVAEDGAGALSLAVFIGNEIVWSRGYGWADIENRIAATEFTIGRVGSISKSFTAVAMVQLAERGIIALDDPVAIYFPEIKGLVDTIGADTPVTFRMLASHTSA